MNKNRIDALSDGIFAIVMTLLVIEIRVPELHHPETNLDLWKALAPLTPLIISYLLSFSVLYTYWRAHSFLISTFSKNVNVFLVNLNAFFLMSIALIPFSSYFLGLYYKFTLGIAVYGINVMICGVLLFGIGTYIIHSDKIENSVKISGRMKRNMYIRSLLPVVGAFLAILLSFWTPTASIILFISTILFNIIPGGLDSMDRLLGLDFEES